MSLADFLTAFDLQRGHYRHSGGAAAAGEDVALDRGEFGRLVGALLPGASAAQVRGGAHLHVAHCCPDWGLSYMAVARSFGCA